MPRRKEPRIPDTLLDQLLAGADPKTVFDPKEPLAWPRVFDRSVPQPTFLDRPRLNRSGPPNGLGWNWIIT
jgi:hypothetical protein